MALTDAKIRNLKPKNKSYKTADYDELYVLTNPGSSRIICQKNSPTYPLEFFQRVITVSLETMKIVNGLPALDID